MRKDWEQENVSGPVTYIWGYDVAERDRAESLEEAMPEAKHIFPLIDNNLTKGDCHAMSYRLGVYRPIMYDMGYQNNNCIGCVKGGMWYWNKIRKDFPDVFATRARQEREIGRSCISGVFLDELEPGRGIPQDEVSQDCGIACLMLG